MELDFKHITHAVIADKRIGSSHYKVPNDGDYGFGGTCFPKDINALMNTMREEGIDPLILEATWEQNIKMRQNWDWAEHTSAVLLK